MWSKIHTNTNMVCSYQEIHGYARASLCVRDMMIRDEPAKNELESTLETQRSCANSRWWMCRLHTNKDV